jgi:hypothetical protein
MLVELRGTEQDRHPLQVEVGALGQQPRHFHLPHGGSSPASGSSPIKMNKPLARAALLPPVRPPSIPTKSWKRTKGTLR